MFRHQEIRTASSSTIRNTQGLPDFGGDGGSAVQQTPERFVLLVKGTSIFMNSITHLPDISAHSNLAPNLPYQIGHKNLDILNAFPNSRRFATNFATKIIPFQKVLKNLKEFFPGCDKFDHNHIPFFFGYLACRLERLLTQWRLQHFKGIF